MTFLPRALVKRYSAELVQFTGYVAVSGCALAIDVVVYWSLLAVAPYAYVAAVGGYVCGVMFHYLLSSRVVFRHLLPDRGLIAESPIIAKFFAAGFIGLLVTVGVVGVLADGLGFYPLPAKICAAGCSFVFVLISMRLFVFKSTANSRFGYST